MLTVHKAVCCVTQHDSLLCFEHPTAGKQIPKGTVELGETYAQACLRELTEETGLLFDGQPTLLGTLERHVSSGPDEDGELERHIWHVFEMPFTHLPHAWTHVAQGGSEEQGLLFRFFWQPLSVAPEGFQDIYVRTIDLVQKAGLSYHSSSRMTAPHDIPSPIDLRLPHDAADWESTAMDKRPWRVEFFDVFASVIAQHSEAAKVLELGSGPGFLATHLLGKLPQLNLHLLDFSEAMHALARARLGVKASTAKYITSSFREPDWSAGLGSFDCVITNQAVHELRHKRHAPALHSAVRTLLRPQGIYLVCDHYAGEDGMQNDQLYMTIQEQKAALLEAGFIQVDQLLAKGGLVLHRAKA